MVSGKAASERRGENQRQQTQADVQPPRGEETRARQLRHTEDVEGQGKPVPGQAVVEDPNLTTQCLDTDQQVLDAVVRRNQGSRVVEPLSDEEHAGEKQS